MAVKHCLLLLATLTVMITGVFVISHQVSAQDLPAGDPPAGLAPGSAAAQDFINICSQHAPKCPLDPLRWRGQPANAWQETGKRSIWYNQTANTQRTVIWEWSAPYQGDNPDYSDHRENHYSDYTSDPNGFPVAGGEPTHTYDWERWEQVGENYLLHQIGREDEESSFEIGTGDCTSGIYYPVIDENLSLSLTPMATQRGETCVLDGYIVTYRTALWGEPMSQTRIENCDKPDQGLPLSVSPKGNTICKVSPYVGTVNQRYLTPAGTTPDQPAMAGCETVTYAWGWQQPLSAYQPHDYQGWYRNGELRYSRWLNFSNEITETLPAYDNHTWWNERCERAWDGMSNYLYSGIYKVGTAIFTDSIDTPDFGNMVVGLSGGSIDLNNGDIMVEFPAGAFTQTVTVSLQAYDPSRLLNTPVTAEALAAGGEFYTLSAVGGSGETLHPILPFTVTVQIDPGLASTAVRDSLALYLWDGAEWAIEVSSSLSPDHQTLTAVPIQFALFGVLGNTHRVFLPLATLGQ